VSNIKISEYSKYVLPLLFLAIILSSYLVIKPLVIVIIASCVLSYVLYPLYKWIKKYLRNRYLSASIVILVILILVLIPAVFVLSQLSQQASVTYVTVKEKLVEFEEMDCTKDSSFICKAYNKFEPIIGSNTGKTYLKEGITNIGKTVSSLAYGVLVAIPGKILDIIIMIFIIFFLLIDGKKVLTVAKKLLPLRIEHEKYILKSLKEIIHAVVFGQVIIAIALGIIGGFGFYIFGIDNAILWGAMITFLGLIPIIGSTMVWVPAAAMLLYNGVTSSDNGLIIKAILFSLYCIIFLAGLDNIVKPKIIGDRAKLHPALVLIGVIGGLSTFGIIGFILGPMILAIFVTFIDIYEREKELERKPKKRKKRK